MCGSLPVLAFTLIHENESLYPLARTPEDGLVQIHIIVHIMPPA
jgi:hypothetical protein